jgi:hypothetical protein
MPEQNFNIFTGLNVGNITANAQTNSLETIGNIAAGNLSATANVLAANLTVNALSNLGAVSNVRITGGSVDQLLRTDGTGNLSWVTVAAEVNAGTANRLAYYAADGSTVSDTGTNLTWNGANLHSAAESHCPLGRGSSQEYAVTGSMGKAVKDIKNNTALIPASL